MTEPELSDLPDPLETGAPAEAAPRPRFRTAVVAGDAVTLVQRLLLLVGAFYFLVALLAFLPGRTAFSNELLTSFTSNAIAGAILAALTPALAGLCGTLAVLRARRRTATDEALFGPDARGLVDAAKIGRAARLGQLVCTALVAAACLAVAWTLRGASPAAPSMSAAGTLCVALAIIAYPLLIGERLLANTSAADLPEAPPLRSLMLLAVAGLPCVGVLTLLIAAGLDPARLGVIAIGALGALVALELILRAAARMFLPAPSLDAARAACTSLLATLLADGTRQGGISGSIRRNLGIDFARSWALSFVRAALPPVLLVVAALSWVMTGLVVVGPDQRAIVERLGDPVAVLHPGLHMAWPWPITRTHVVDNGTTRETNLSGDGALPLPRLARADDRAVPEADRLWQQTHTSERLFLIASATGDVQSFQAMGADIRLIWRVGPTDADALAFAYQTTDPERLMVAIAGRALADTFASETIESVLGENRLALASGLARRIQNGIDQADLGIRLVAVVIEAMHPPTGAASAFHAVQAAEITAQTAVATERGNAVGSRAQAQAIGLDTIATAIGNAAEARATATVTSIGFAADRTAAQIGGPTFTLERYFANLAAVANRTTLTVIDHRVIAAQAPTIDLRLPSASGSNGQ